MATSTSLSNNNLKQSLLPDRDPDIKKDALLNDFTSPSAHPILYVNGNLSDDSVSPTSGGSSLSTLLMSPHAKPGEFVSKQRARELSNLYLCPYVSLKHCMLICICFLTFGSYWVYDTPGALLNQFIVWFGNGFDDGSNANFYSVYSYPNTILPFFSGIIVDKYTGVKYGAILFISLVTLGEFTFAIGVQTKMYYIALLGRFIFGLGGESLTVVQNLYTVRWFEGQRLALAFGLVLAFSRVGTSVNFVVTPIFADIGVPFSVWFGLGMCVISFTMCVFAGLLDNWGDKTIDRERETLICKLTTREQEYIREQDQLHEPKNDDVNIKDIRLMPIEAFLLYFVCVLFYIGVLTFYTVAQDILSNTGNKYSNDTSDLFISIPSFVSIIAVPIFGYLVDKIGKALYWIVLASTILLLGHLAFLGMAYDLQFLLDITPIPVMIWIGIGYAMGAASIWPILSYILDKKLLGTGYGMMTAIQNLGLAVFPEFISLLRGMPDAKNTQLSYMLPIFVFMTCEGLAVLLTIILIGKDKLSGGRLNASGKERAAAKAAAEGREEEGEEEEGEEEGEEYEEEEDEEEHDDEQIINPT